MGIIHDDGDQFIYDDELSPKGGFMPERQKLQQFHQ